MDVLSPYHQIVVDEVSIPKSAIVCKYGQLECARAPFGLKNIPGLWLDIFEFPYLHTNAVLGIHS